MVSILKCNLDIFMCFHYAPRCTVEFTIMPFVCLILNANIKCFLNELRVEKLRKKEVNFAINKFFYQMERFMIISSKVFFLFFFEKTLKNLSIS